MNALSIALRHQYTQEKMREHSGKMRHQEGQLKIETTASNFGRLALQLYTQLYFQVEFMHDEVKYSINYFS